MMKNSLTWQTSSVLAVPQISITASTQINLTWPVTAAGFYLEQATALSGAPAWTPLLLISNQTGLAIPPTNPQGFYRLHKP